jgi:hypothetical protein
MPIQKKQLFDDAGEYIGIEVKCYCNRKLVLFAYDDFCECGQMFNAFGQALKPQNQWEEQDDY